MRRPFVSLVLSAALFGCTNKDSGNPDTGPVEGGAPGKLVVDCASAGVQAFGDADHPVTVGSTATLNVKASNEGDLPVLIQGVDMGPNPPFDAVATGGITISGGSSYQFQVKCQPDGFDNYTGTLTISSYDLSGDTGGGKTPNDDVSCTFSCSVETDADGDGYTSTDAGGDDCDDTDASINPGATESWYDGVDQNCDGQDDFDQDGDGYESKVFNPDSTAGGGDCQDADPDIHPGASDTYYDGIDSNCDGLSDYDADGDGYTSSAYGGTDCDDANATVNPAGTEVFDGADNDCNGVVDDHTTADGADVIITGDSSTDGAGSGVAVADIDGSGTKSLIIGASQYATTTSTALEGTAQGAIAVFQDEDWVTGDVLSSGDNFVTGSTSTEEFGGQISNVGDFDGDGAEDVAVSSIEYTSKEGRVYLFSGVDLPSAASADDAWLTLEGSDDYQLGTALETKVDLNGDGAGDLVAFGVDSYEPYNLLALQYGGDASGDYAWTDIDSTWKYTCGTASTASSTSTTSYCGGPTGRGGSEIWPYAAGYAYDLDGDGIQDMLLGDPYADDAAKQAGRAWILWGKSQDYAYSNGSLNGTTTTEMEGAAVKDYVGYAVGAVPDVDGDGAAEIFIEKGASGDMYFFYGGDQLRTGGLTSSDAAATFFYDTEPDVATGFMDIGDWSGDGTDDFGILFSQNSKGYLDLYFSQKWSGSDIDPAAEVHASIYGSSTNDTLGSGHEPAPVDVNGDGKTDIVLGDPGYSSGAGGVEILLQP